MLLLLPIVTQHMPVQTKQNNTTTKLQATICGLSSRPVIPQTSAGARTCDVTKPDPNLSADLSCGAPICAERSAQAVGAAMNIELYNQALYRRTATLSIITDLLRTDNW